MCSGVIRLSYILYTYYMYCVSSILSIYIAVVRQGDHERYIHVGI